MKTIQVQIEDDKLELFLNIIQNLKEDVVNSFTIQSNDNIKQNLKIDPFFYERQKELCQIKDDIKSGKMKMYNFNDSMDELLEELQA